MWDGIKFSKVCYTLVLSILSPFLLAFDHIVFPLFSTTQTFMVKLDCVMLVYLWSTKGVFEENNSAPIDMMECVLAHEMETRTTLE